VLGSRVFVATGENGSFVTNTWEYNPAADRWTEKTAFEATSRSGACAMNVNNHVYVLTGRNGSLVMDNVQEFQPDSPKVAND
jgi:hypothetical protein